FRRVLVEPLGGDSLDRVLPQLTESVRALAAPSSRAAFGGVAELLVGVEARRLLAYVNGSAVSDVANTILTHCVAPAGMPCEFENASARGWARFIRNCKE